MTENKIILSPSGVRIAADFRDNLIIDRYDPIFTMMRSSKLEHLRSENSEDAVTWNVFRSLRQLEPQTWVPPLLRIGIPKISIPITNPVVVNLWSTVSPPPGLLVLGEEGDSEIDVIIENPSWVWFIEAKFQSDISPRTTARPLRDQVLRNIDVGSYYAGVRDFFFSLLIRQKTKSPLGVEAIERYSDLKTPRSLLAEHRPDGLSNLKAVTLLTWANLSIVLQEAHNSALRSDEQGYAERALSWMREKGLLGDAG